MSGESPGEGYRDVVSECLKQASFETVDMSWEADSFRDAYYINIIAPLLKLVWAAKRDNGWSALTWGKESTIYVIVGVDIQARIIVTIKDDSPSHSR